MTPEVRALIDLLPDLVLLVEADGRVVSGNRRLARRLGLTTDALAGRSIRDLTAPPANRTSTYLRRCAGSRQPLPGSITFRLPDGGTLVCRCDGAALRPATPRTQALVLLRCQDRDTATSRFSLLNRQVADLTREIAARQQAEAALRLSEEQFRADFELAGVGRAHTDIRTKRLLRVNRKFCEMTGYTAEELARMDFTDLTHPDDREENLASVGPFLGGEVSNYETEKRYVRKDGTTIWVHVSGALVRDEEGRPLRAITVIQDVTARRIAEERQQLLIDELNHRVKNTLSTVRSIADQTIRTTTDPEAFRIRFGARLRALSATHNLLSRGRWQGATLRDIIVGELAPYSEKPESRYRLRGGDIVLEPRLALALGMAFHELATNAAKYGALSAADGRVDVTWHVDAAPDARRLHIVWTEVDGPPVGRPQRRGFGSVLIERGLRHELDAEVTLKFAREGVRCEIAFALDGETMSTTALSGAFPQ